MKLRINSTDKFVRPAPLSLYDLTLAEVVRQLRKGRGLDEVFNEVVDPLVNEGTLSNADADRLLNAACQ